MPLVSTNQPNLINGVSQQADSLKFATQAVEQVNGYSSIVEGLIKRNPTRHIAKLTTATANTPAVHLINRDSVERYNVLIQDGSIRVFDLAGTEKTVNAPHGYTYLTGANRDNIRCVTIADYTFVLNTDKTVAMDAATTAAFTSMATLHILQGAYNVTYSINLAVGATYYTATFVSGSTAGAASTIEIAEALKNAMLANASINSLYNVTRGYGNIIYVTKKDGGQVSLTYTDSVGNTYGKVANDTAASLASLPSAGRRGQLVKITGGTDGVKDDYWVTFVPDSALDNNGTGRWKETVAPAIKYKLDSSTMPFVLIRLASGQFLFAKADGSTQSSYALPAWGERKYGTVDSNPDPSFVGTTINDITLFRSRLTFASGENISLSESSSFFNFFRTSLQSLLDADPIDVAVTSSKVSIIYNMIPFSEKLLLFSDQSQFSLTSADILTPKTVSIQQTTEFSNDSYTKAINVGKNVLFPFVRGEYSGVMEYFVSPLTSLFDGLDVTAPVSKYIEGSIVKLATSNNEQIVVALSDGFKNGCYIYKYFYSGEEKIQSSWSKWEFDVGCEILSAEFIESTLYLTIKRADGVFLEKVNIEVGFKDAYSDFSTRLDRRLTNSATTLLYNATSDTTKITLPYAYTGADTLQVVTRDASATTATGGRVLNIFQGNYAASFNGNGQYLEASTSAETTVGSGSFAFSGWINLDALVPFTPILSNADAEGGGFELFTSGTGNKLVAYGSPVGGSYVNTPDTSTALVVGTWYFINVWFDTSDRKLRLSVNDQASTFYDLVESPASVVGTTEGYYLDTPAYFKGSMDQMAFWKRVLTPTERSYLYNSGAGVSFFDIPVGLTVDLAAWWRLEEATGTRFDSYGSVNLADFGGVTSVSRTTNFSYTSVVAQGDLTAVPFYVGLSYDMLYKFSTPLIRQASGQGKIAVTDGRLQVKTGNLTYNNSLFFKVLVTSKYRDTYTYKFTGARLGTGGATIGRGELVSGAFKFPVMAKNDMVDIELHNDSPFPCSLLSMDWESWYQTRNQRLG
jgi:hypothetical protein